MSESVSVILPAWNAGKFLERAVRSALGQTSKPERIVVVNDGSEDNTWQIVLDMAGPQGNEKPGLAHGVIDGVDLIGLNRPRTNVSVTRNVGIGYVWPQTTVFALLDADDWYAPEKIEKSLAALALHPAVGCVTSDYDDLMPDGRFYRRYKSAFDGPQLMRFNGCNTNCLIRRAAFEKLGGLFDETLAYCEDYDLFLRLAEVGLIYHIPEVLHHRQEHDTNISRDWDTMVRHEILVKQKMLQRRGLA